MPAKLLVIELYLSFLDTVPKKNNKANVEEKKKEENETSFEHLKPIFEQGNDFDDQLSSFLNAIALSKTEIETLYETVCVNLNRIFQQSFPKCKTHRFGSTVTELCFKNCDLDIYMDIGTGITCKFLGVCWTGKLE